jgi:virginiamycin B lyase
MSARDFRPLFIALLFGVSVSAHSETKLPEGAGREIVQSKCAGCHPCSTPPASNVNS